MVQLSATKRTCIAIFRVSIVSFAAITLCVASQRVIPKVSVNFVIGTVRKLLDTPSCQRFREPEDSGILVLLHVGILSHRESLKTSIWMHLAQDTDQWRALVNTVMNLRVP
jgi:hypothetical protein